MRVSSNYKFVILQLRLTDLCISLVMLFLVLIVIGLFFGVFPFFLVVFLLQAEEAELQKKAKEEEDKLKKLQSLFDGCRFFLSREVPREALTFVLRSFGGVVSWEETGSAGAPYPESDETITHEVVDRPTLSHRYLSRSV